MVSVLARWPVILLVVLVGVMGTVGQLVREAGGQSATPPPQGSRVWAQNGDTIIIEGDDQVSIIHRRPAYVRIVADVDRALAIVVAEYLEAAGDRSTGVSDRAFVFYNIEGHSRWPVPDRWEGQGWLEEYIGSTAKERRPFLLVETPEGDIVFGVPDPAFPYPPHRPTTGVRFGGVSTNGGKRPFDVAEQETLEQIAKNKGRQPLRK